MPVLLLDFETTGLDATKDRIIEIGAMVTTNDFTVKLETMNHLVKGPDYPALTQEITEITKITPAMLECAITPEEMMHQLAVLIVAYLPSLDGVVAYNMPFDGDFLRHEVARQAATMGKEINILMQTQFVCAMRDVEENLKCKSWKLMHVALDHGVTVNPKELHRAINDVELMRITLVEIGQTFEKMLAYRDEPTVYVVAKCLPPWKDDGASTTIAKGLGFSWQVARGDSEGRVIKDRWVRKLKQKDWVKLRETSPIPVALI